MRITYDAEVDALYIRFRETTVTTQELGEGIAIDVDASGQLAGIEVLDVKRRLGDGEDIFRHIILDNIGLAQPA